VTGLMAPDSLFTKQDSTLSGPSLPAWPSPCFVYGLAHLVTVAVKTVRLSSALSGVGPARGIRTSVSVSSLACILTFNPSHPGPPDGTGSPRSKQHCADQYAAGSTQC